MKKCRPPDTSATVSIRYDLHPDGKRLALVAEKAQADVVNDKVVLIFNFFDELKRVLPVKRS